MYPNAYNVYKNNSVNYSSKEQLLLMLVDGAVRFAKQGRQAIIDKNYKKTTDSLVKVQEIFSELIVSLDIQQAPWTENLLKIYDFIKRKAVEANMKKSVEILDELIPLIEDVSNLWHDVYKAAKK